MLIVLHPSFCKFLVRLEFFFCRSTSSKSKKNRLKSDQFSETKKEKTQTLPFFWQKTVRSKSFVFCTSMHNTNILVADFFQSAKKMFSLWIGSKRYRKQANKFNMVVWWRQGNNVYVETGRSMFLIFFTSVNSSSF